MDKKVKVIKRQSIATMLVDDLRNRLLSGEFKNGSILRQESIAQEYGVSRMPVREALRRLVTEGLVVIEDNRSARVSELSIEEIDEIFDIRLKLEPDLLYHAIPNMTNITKAKTQKIIDELDSAYKNSDSSCWGQLNGQFHMSLYEPSKRSFTLAIVNRLCIQVDRYLRVQMSVTEDMYESALEHKTMFDLAYNKKTPEAIELLTLHISRTKKQLAEILIERYKNLAT